MSRYTVWWHIGAQEDLAAIWIESRFRGRLDRAIKDLEQGLASRPASIGEPHGLSRLDDESVRLVLKRLAQLPEDLRTVDIGSIVVQFFVVESIALVVVVRLTSGEQAF
jgi:hypothetical protein